jgi:hypothetical protein
MIGHGASLDTFTDADISRLRVTGSGSFEIRDFIEYRRIKYERNTGRKNFEGYRRS